MKRTNSWDNNAIAKHISIWSKNFQLKEIKKPKSPKKSTPKKEKQLPVRTPSTRGQVAVMKTESLKNQLTPRKRSREGKSFIFFNINNEYFFSCFAVINTDKKDFTGFFKLKNFKYKATLFIHEKNFLSLQQFKFKGLKKSLNSLGSIKIYFFKSTKCHKS